VDADSDIPAVKLAAARDKARVSISLWAERQQKKSGTVYTYYFDRPIPWPEHPEFGAFHTSEIPYMFHNLEKLDRPWEPVDRTVSAQMSSYWVNFAAKGNPNGEGLAEWPAFDASKAVTMRLGEQMGPMPIGEPEKVEFWKAFYAESPN
jgi:para-nitrobenzyl esterase